MRSRRPMPINSPKGTWSALQEVGWSVGKASRPEDTSPPFWTLRSSSSDTGSRTPSTCSASVTASSVSDGWTPYVPPLHNAALTSSNPTIGILRTVTAPADPGGVRTPVLGNAEATTRSAARHWRRPDHGARSWRPTRPPTSLRGPLSTRPQTTSCPCPASCPCVSWHGHGSPDQLRQQRSRAPRPRLQGRKGAGQTSCDDRTCHRPGGLLIRHTETGITASPGCCFGLENWRDWLVLMDGEEPGSVTIPRRTSSTSERSSGCGPMRIAWKGSHRAASGTAAGAPGLGPEPTRRFPRVCRRVGSPLRPAPGCRRGRKARRGPDHRSPPPGKPELRRRPHELSRRCGDAASDRRRRSQSEYGSSCPALGCRSINAGRPPPRIPLNAKAPPSPRSAACPHACALLDGVVA